MVPTHIRFYTNELLSGQPPSPDELTLQNPPIFTDWWDKIPELIKKCMQKRVEIVAWCKPNHTMPYVMLMQYLNPLTNAQPEPIPYRRSCIAFNGFSRVSYLTESSELALQRTSVLAVPSLSVSCSKKSMNSILVGKQESNLTLSPSAFPCALISQHFFYFVPSVCTFAYFQELVD